MISSSHSHIRFENLKVTFQKISLTLVLILAMTAVTHAGRYSRLVIFGDSVTDQGNVWLGSNIKFPPSPPYDLGRFSNGPVWVEYLAPMLGVPVPQASLAGGTNFAYGGALTGFEYTPERGGSGIDVPGTGKQVELFLAREKPRPDDLFILKAGYNDFGTGGQTDPLIPAQNMAQQIRTLAAAGGRHFMVSQLAGSLDPVQDALRNGFNSQIDKQVNELRSELGQYVLVASWNSLVASLFGPGNGFITTGFAYDSQTGVLQPNADQYACWDSACHFTTRGHEFMANQVYAGTLAREVGDLNRDKAVDARDIDLLTGDLIRGGRRYDLNHDRVLDLKDHRFWVTDMFRTYAGDANLDREFNSDDLTAVFQANQYEDGIALNSGWATGDWNGDSEFDLSDLVAAFQDGGYEKGPRPGIANVPEPTSMGLCVLGLMFLSATRTFVDPVCRRLFP